MDKAEQRGRQQEVGDFNLAHEESTSHTMLGDSPFEKFDISDVIDLSIWEVINEQTKNNIAAVVLARLRPDGIADSLWSELSHTDKVHIISSRIRNEGSYEHPDEVNFSTWSMFHPGTRKDIKCKLYTCRPSGFDSELWNGLSDITKQHIGRDIHQYKLRPESDKEIEYKKNPMNCIPWKTHNWLMKEAPGSNLRIKRTYIRYWIQRLTFNSRILTFFFSGAHIIEDPDSGIGAMTLVCALILTIPFGVLSFINDQFFTSIYTGLQLCPNGLSSSGLSYEMIHNIILKSLSACIYFSIMGLILSSIYYVFKPIPGKDLENWCQNQGRFLMASLFIITALDIAGLLTLGKFLMGFQASMLSNICTYDIDKYFTPGIYGVVVSFAVGVGCML